MLENTKIHALITSYWWCNEKSATQAYSHCKELAIIWYTECWNWVTHYLFRTDSLPRRGAPTNDLSHITCNTEIEVDGSWNRKPTIRDCHSNKIWKKKVDYFVSNKKNIISLEIYHALLRHIVYHCCQKTCRNQTFHPGNEMN